MNAKAELAQSNNLKILIIGKGYIGNYLAKGNKKYDITHIGKSDLQYQNIDKFLEFIDINKKFDWIINCSGYTGKPNVESCEDNKELCYHYNVTVPISLTKIANLYKIPIIHIGSGCIYDGYSKNYNENDFPNFGLTNKNSSFYSKTKHAFEKLSNNLDRYIFRIRIPFNGTPEPKNYISKILRYGNLINCQNSITNVDDFINFVYNFIEEKRPLGIYNVTNEGSINAEEIIKILKSYGLSNPNWKFVNIQDMNFKVARSNCILDTSKIKNLNLQLPNVKESIVNSIQNYLECQKNNNII